MSSSPQISIGWRLRVVAMVAFAAIACGLQEHIQEIPNVLPTEPSGGGAGSDGAGGAPGATGGTVATVGGGGSSRSGSGGGGGRAVPGSGGSAGAAAGPPAGGNVGSADAPVASPPPDPQNPTIDINGTKVPRDKAIVFIHFGHSNMAGLAQDPADLKPYHFTTQAQLWSYQGRGRFVAAKEPTAPDPPIHLGAGPGMAWLKAAAAAAGPDYHFISIARGKGGATSADYLKGGLYYSTFVDRAVELKGKVTFGALFVMMGITDRHLPDGEQNGFPDRMAQIIADIRADLGEPNLPVLHTEYELTATGDLAITGQVGMKFRPLVAILPEKISNLVLVPTDGMPLRDDHHFNLIGQKMWADRGIQLMIDKGWFPWRK